MQKLERASRMQNMVVANWHSSYGVACTQSDCTLAAIMYDIPRLVTSRDFLAIPTLVFLIH